MTTPRRVIPPFRGASNNRPYVDTPGDLAPLEALRNFHAHGPGADRFRGGQRWGAARVYGQPLRPPGVAAADIQAIRSVTRARSIASLTLGEPRLMDGGTTKEADPLVGVAWLLDDVPSMNAALDLDVTQAPYNATQRNPAVTVAVSHDGVLAAFAVNILAPTSSTGFTQAVVRVVNMTTGAAVSTFYIQESGVNRFVNTLAFGRTALYIATNEKVVWIDPDTGTGIGTSTCNGWSSEVIEVETWYDDDAEREYVFALFRGASAAAVLPNGGVVNAGIYARHFRSGIMKFEVGEDGFGLPTLTQVAFGDTLSGADTWYEPGGSGQPHRYHRISEHTIRRRLSGIIGPWGWNPTAMAVDPRNGNVVIAGTNQAYGPNTNFRPDGEAPYLNIYAVNFQGTRLWEADTESIVETGHGGYDNDIPTVSGDEPSIQCLAIDIDGDVYAAGRANQADQSVFKLAGRNGTIMETRGLMGLYTASAPQLTHRQACIAIDPFDQNLLVGGDRNNDWEGGGGTINAHLWKLNRIDFSLVWEDGYDIAESVAALGVAARDDGTIIYSTGVVT